MGVFIARTDPVREAQAVQDDQHGAPLMSDHRERKRQVEEQATGNQDQHGTDRDDEVLPDDRGRPSGQAVCIGQLLHVLRQKSDIGRLKCDIRPGCSHRDADIGPGQCRSIVHAVPDESDLAMVCKLTDRANLVLRKHLGMNFIGNEASSAPMRSATGLRSPVIMTTRLTPPARSAASAGAELGSRLVRHADCAENGRSTPEIDHGLGAVGEFPKCGMNDAGSHLFGEVSVPCPYRTKRIVTNDSGAWAGADIGDFCRLDAMRNGLRRMAAAT